jgi:hypothetical protein
MCGERAEVLFGREHGSSEQIEVDSGQRVLNAHTARDAVLSGHTDAPNGCLKEESRH